MLDDPAAPTAKPAISRGSDGNTRTIRDDRWRLIVDGQGKRPELFDYLADPGETKNLAAEHPEIVQKLSGSIR
jgi:arylsulfatase A-like enzyme